MNMETTLPEMIAIAICFGFVWVIVMGILAILMALVGKVING